MTRSGFSSLLVTSLLLYACSRDTSEQARKQYDPGKDGDKGALLSPVDDDSSADIVSWVDGKAVTDWNAEIGKRDAAIDGYLNDADPGHAAKYGFRSGQTPRLAWDWFRNNPVGFNGVPYVLFKTLIDLDPNHPDPVLRTIARVWKHQAAVPYGSGTPAEQWTFDHLGVEPSPQRYVNGVAQPASARPGSLPFGFAFENPRSFPPL